MNKKSLTVPFLITLLATVLMVVSVFLPYMTATGDVASEIRGLSEALLEEDLSSFSMPGFAKFCASLTEGISDGNVVSGLLYTLVGLVGGFALLAALFALLKKPIPVIVFTVLSFLVFLLQGVIFGGVIQNSDVYTWGIGYYLFMAAAVAAFAAAIWLKVCKCKLARQMSQT